jgi:hypothetical protein
LNDITFKRCKKAITTAKLAAGKNKIIGTYSGYSFHYAGATALHRSGLQILSRLFKLSSIDFIATPIDYGTRRGGQVSAHINAFNGSAALHKKLLIREEDLRTHTYPKPMHGRTADREETIEVIRRDFGHSLAENYGLWLFPIGGNDAFHETETMQAISQLKKIGDNSLKIKHKKRLSEVAFIFDENKSLNYLSWNSSFVRRHVWDCYKDAIKMGVPFDVYMLDDILRADAPDYKLYIFINLYYTNNKLRQTIAKKVRKNNAVSVWCYAPGYISDNGFGTDTMKKLTGIRLIEDRTKKSFRLSVSNKDNPIVKYTNNFRAHSIGPSFYVNDPKAKICAYAGDKGGLAVKEFKNWRSVYSLMPLNKELLMGLCDYAGVHVYSRSFDVLNLNESYLMLHSVKKGKKIIKLKQPAKITELISGKIIGKNIDTIRIDVPAKTTKLFRIESNK